MRSGKALLAAGAACLFSSAAFGADMPSLAPPPNYGPPLAEDLEGWYLRGDIGFSNQRVSRLESPGYHDPGITVAPTIGLGFDAAGIAGLGAGYQFNNWFRTDLTGEYRGRSNMHGLDIVRFNGAVIGADSYNASKSEWLLLANAYVDLGTWWCVTPFVGAGLGLSRNAISSFLDTNTPNRGVAYAPAASRWDLAWALHAGLAYRLSTGLTLELAYRYVSLGDGETGAVTNFQGFSRGRTVEFKDITSHDAKIGIRWELDSPPVYDPPALIRKG